MLLLIAVAALLNHKHPHLVLKVEWSRVDGGRSDIGKGRGCWNDRRGVRLCVL